MRNAAIFAERALCKDSEEDGAVDPTNWRQRALGMMIAPDR